MKKLAHEVCESITNSSKALKVRKLIEEYEDGRCPTNISKKGKFFIVQSGESVSRVMDDTKFINYVCRMIKSIYKEDAIGSYGDVFGEDGFHNNVKLILKIK